MNDELNLEELEQIDQKTEAKLQVKNRFEQLSEKVRVTAQEKETEATARKEAEERATTAEKERDFYKNFSALSAQYPAAAEYQDQIREKVGAGYTEEDAVLAVLAKEGKLTPPAPADAPPPPVPSPEGGSAPTIIPGEKAIADMTAEEKFAALSALSNEAVASALRGQR